MSTVHRHAAVLRLCVLAVGASLLLAPAMSACSAPEVVERKPRPKKQAEPPPSDFFDEFGGDRVPPAVAFTISNNPVGVDDVRVIVALIKTEWLIREDAHGKEHKEAIAHVMVQRDHEVMETLRIHTGESDTALGVRVEVRHAGEDYDEKTMRWLAHAELVVSAAQ